MDKVSPVEISLYCKFIKGSTHCLCDKIEFNFVVTQNRIQFVVLLPIVKLSLQFRTYSINQITLMYACNSSNIV